MILKIIQKRIIHIIPIIKSVLLNAKKSFNNDHDTIYRLEDIEFEMVSVLKQFKAIQGYLMKSIKAELEETRALYMRR